MAHHDPGAVRSDRLRRLRELLLAEAQELGAHQAGDAGPAKTAEHQEDDADRGVGQMSQQRRRLGLGHRSDDRQRQERTREREHQVGAAHEERIGAPAGVTRAGAQERADSERDHLGHHTHLEGDARSVDQAAQQIAPESVGAQQVLPTRRGRRRDQARSDLFVGVVTQPAGQERSGRGAQNEHADQESADDKGKPRARPEPRARGRRLGRHGRTIAQRGAP